MSILRCPVCKSDLLAQEKIYVCANNHSFDIARQGYVNLLLSSQRPSKAPGDSAEMIADRHAFLNAGFYAPLRERLVDALTQLQHSRLDANASQNILDLGCGEGYYTAALIDTNRQVFGLDISKPALVAAARRSDQATWCIGTSRALPFHDRSFEAVLNIFCRPHWQEIARVLRNDGTLLFAGPGAQHLRELREALYENVSTHTDESLDMAARHGFVQTQIETLQFPMALTQPPIMQLARMTPHYWRAPAERRTRLEQIDNLQIHTEFVIRHFKKIN